MAYINQQLSKNYMKPVTGKDGLLYFTTANGVNAPMGEVDSFRIQGTIDTEEWHPVGQLHKVKIPLASSYTLTVSETVVRDDFIISELVATLGQGWVPYFAFQCVLARRDGQEERVVLRGCIPDGSFDIMNIEPGTRVKREWTFAINEPPEILNAFFDA